MTNPTMPQLQGNPIWFALPTPNPQAAKQFYSAMFGWQWADVQMPNGTYHMAIRDDANIVGMHLETPRDATSENDRNWDIYIHVDDAQEIAERIAANSGAVIQEPSHVKMPGDAAYIGITATVANPEGAVFRLWQPGTGKGAEVFDKPGAVCWTEYHSPNIQQAMQWYSEIFGAHFSNTSIPATEQGAQDFEMNILTIGEQLMPCAIFPITQESSRATWRIYFRVRDAYRAAEKATRLGASVVTPPSTVANGSLAALRDPQGVNFSIWGKEEEED